MKNQGKLKTFENYDASKSDVSGDEVNGRIKEVISNMLKTRQYFMLLQDTAEHVYDMIEKQIPPNIDAFANALYEKDELLANVIDNILEILDNSIVLQELDEIVVALTNLDKYTEKNMDNILKGVKTISEEEDYEEEDEDEDEDEDVEENSLTNPFDLPENTPKRNKVEEEDQLKRKIKPVKESLKKKDKSIGKIKDIEEFLKRNKPMNKFRKGEIVFINGIKNESGKKFNGHECIVINKSDDRENCYDLFDLTRSGDKSISNLNGFPEEYLFKEKPIKITEAQPEKRRPAATKKSNKNETE